MAISNVADILRHHAAERPDEPALVMDDRTMSWAELYERASRVAAGLAAAGVGSQDRIGFVDKNGIEHFEVFFGAALANAVCVDVNWRLAPPEVEFIVNDAAAKVLVVGRDFVPVLDAIADALTSVGTILVIGGHEKYQDYDEWVASHPAADPHGAERRRRRRVPALLERDDGPPEGRDALERQLLRPAPGGHRHVGLRRRLGEPRRDAAVPHRRRWVGGGRDVQGRHERRRARPRPGGARATDPERRASRTPSSCRPRCSSC